jgi:hydrogenase maturation protease
MTKPVAVLGLGNPLMADEGIGVFLIERLSQWADRYPAVDFIDAGTGGLSVLHQIEGRRKVVFIDCALMNETPGAIRRFTPDEVRSRKVLAHQSLHEADLLRVIAMAKELGQSPEEVVIFGIQPQVIEAGRDLSPALADRVDEYLALVAREFDK